MVFVKEISDRVIVLVGERRGEADQHAPCLKCLLPNNAIAKSRGVKYGNTCFKLRIFIG